MRNLGFIDETAESIHVPVGGEFQPTGFIGPWMGTMLWRLYTQAEMDQKTDKVFLKSGEGPDFWYYWKDAVAAAEAVKRHSLTSNFGGSEPKPQVANQIWRLEVPVAKILNFRDEETAAKFSKRPTIFYEVDVAGLRSKKRANFHMVALPMAVQAAALACGHITERIFSIAELTDQGTVFSDEFQAHYIGSPDALKVDDPLHYSHSTLWQRRADLWKALGEENPDVFAIDSPIAKANTQAKALRQCLSIALKPWKGPVLARVVTATDPHMGATYTDGNGETKRRQVAVLYELFDDEKAAKAAAEADKARMNGGDEPANGNGKDKAKGKPEQPPLPKDWEGMEDEWLERLSAMIEGEASPKTISEDLGCTIAEATKWRKYLMEG